MKKTSLRIIPETERIIYILGLILLGGFLLLFILYHTGLFNPAETLPGCSFLWITGHYCPGCGGTRSVMALIQGHILDSFRYHPVVLYAGIWYLFFLGSHTIALYRIKQKSPDNRRLLSHIHGMKFRVCYVYIGLAILLLQWIAKNILNRPYLF